MKQSKLILSALLALVILTSCSDFTAKENETGKVYIVSVGINYLENKTLSGYTVYQLNVCPCDALDVATWFEKIYEDKGIECETHLLISEKSDDLYGDFSNKINDKMLGSRELTGSKIIETIKNLKTEKSDLILFYYSGHGKSENGVPMLVTLSEKNSNNAEFTTTSDIIDALSEKNCRSVVLLDCCENGSDFENGEANDSVSMFSSLLTKLNTSKVSVIASCSQVQDSNIETFLGKGDYKDGQHSLFTEILLSALGYQNNEIPEKMSVKQLFEETLNKGGSIWKSAYQEPEMNFTELDTVIIPEV